MADSIINAKELYDYEVATKLTLIGEILSFTTVFFTLILLFIVISKTPKNMARFKFYFIQYLSFALLLEIVMLIFPATILHPFLIISTHGFAWNIHPHIRYMLYFFAACNSISLMSCSIAIIYERYFALTKIKMAIKPIYLYGILMTFNIGIFIFVFFDILLNPSSNLFVMSLSESEAYLRENNIMGLEPIIDHLIVSQTLTKDESLPLLFMVVGSYAIFLTLLAFIGLYLNLIQSRKNQAQISLQVQKATDLFKIIIYIQFIGYFFFITVPFFIIVFTFLFIETPSNLPNYSFLSLIGYGLYDTIFTGFLIKPYRKVILKPWKIFKNKIKPSNNQLKSIFIKM